MPNPDDAAVTPDPAPSEELAPESAPAVDLNAELMALTGMLDIVNKSVGQLANTIDLLDNRVRLLEQYIKRITA